MMIVFLNLLFTDAIFAGITKGMNDNKINFQYGEVIIEPAKGEELVFDANKIINNFKDKSYVEKVSPIIKIGVSYTNQKEKDGRDEEKMAGFLMGIDLKNNADDFVFNIKDKIVDGRMLREDDVNKIILGTNLAGGYGASVFPDDLGGVRVGDRVLVERQGTHHEYEVVGIFKTKNFDIDARGIIPEKELRRLTGLFSGADEVVFRLNNPDKSQELIKEIKESGYGKYEISD
jgi:putative ABC transport system permease protein